MAAAETPCAAARVLKPASQPSKPLALLPHPCANTGPVNDKTKRPMAPIALPILMASPSEVGSSSARPDDSRNPATSGLGMRRGRPTSNSRQRRVIRVTLGPAAIERRHVPVVEGPTGPQPPGQVGIGQEQLAECDS